MSPEPNVLLIVLDAVRPDHLSTYGYARETDPFLASLAEESHVFENAFANSNWTPTSHAAIFTGLLPSQSGVYGDNLTLPESRATLAERLREQGYRTFATAAGAHIRSDRGFDRGFDEFHETYRIAPSWQFLSQAVRDPSAVKQLAYSLIKGHDNYTYYKVDRLKKWLSTGDEPFFAFVNFKTAHHPYNPPRPYKSLFSDVERPPLDVIELLAEKLRQEPQNHPEREIDRLRRISREYPIIADALDPSRDELATVEAWYDGAIRYMDAQIEELVTYLRSIEELENTYVIVTADHGEQFGEHGLGKHRYSLYDDLLRVPLVVRTPSGEGTREEGMVSLLDLFPTITTIAGDNGPMSELTTDLLNGSVDHEHVFAEVGRKSPDPVRRIHPSFGDSCFNGPAQCIRSSDRKLVRWHDKRELYDWRNDPDERTDLSAGEPAVAETLETRLLEYVERMNGSAYREKSDDERLKQQLEDLGYI